MSKARQLHGHKKTHPHYGKVKVIGVVPGSRTMVKIKCVYRGPGWNPEKKTYTGYKNTVGWMRGENYLFDTVHEAHIKELN